MHVNCQREPLETLSRIPVLDPNNQHNTRIEGLQRGAARARVCLNGSPASIDRGLPMRFCRTPFRALWALDRFPAYHSLGYLAGSDRPSIRLSFAPNNRVVWQLSDKADHVL